MYCLIVATPINALLQYVLVWSPYSVGFIGASIATSITNISIPLYMLVYLRSKKTDTWGKWNLTEALDARQIWQFLKLGGPGILMLTSEWWIFESNTHSLFR